MSWGIDSITFATYGVKVLKATGLLDMPRMLNEGYDWLDLDGKDYRDAVGDLLYGDREIVLSCFIKSDSYANFKTAVQTFYTAMVDAGYRTLNTPYGNISGCFLQNGIELVRQTSYLSDYQLGLFSLRFTVHVNSEYKSYPVIHSSGTPVVGYLVTNNMQIRRTLQGDSYATCSLELSAPLAVDMYAYILINTNGVTAEPYYFMCSPDVKKVSTNKYVYSLRLDHGSVLLKQSQFLFEGRSEFDIFANLDEIMDLVVENADRFIDDKFIKGDVEPTIKKNHTFKGEDCYTVVQRLAKEYGLEYDIRFGGSIGPKYQIDLKKQIATTKEITLEYGKGNGLFELSREPIDRSKLVTVLYAYGAAKNLKHDYRGGKTRLEFDGNPLQNNVNLYMGVEKTVFFDEVYPQRTATVQAYEQILKVASDDPNYAAYAAIKEIWPGGLYKITDTTCFNINDYLRGGLTAKIRMKTGDLAGYEFEIEKYDHDTGSIYIIPFKDEIGLSLPNADLIIQANDEYTLVDIDQPASYVATAEAELLALAQEYLDRYSVPEYPFTAKVDPAFLAGITDRFEVGDRITIVDDDLNINQLYRISELVYNAHTGVYDLTLSEQRILNRRERMQIDVDKINRTLEATNSETVEVIRKDKETATELRNRIFTPADDLQNLDMTVRNESIDPRMLAHDAGVPQFTLKGLLVQTNYSGDENAVHVTAGKLVAKNWPSATKLRFDISLDRENYNPTRSWLIAAHDFYLDSEKDYYLYAKLPLDEEITTGALEIEEEHVEVKRYIEDGYIYHQLGAINLAQSPRVAAMLWGNVKAPEVDPRMIGGGTLLYMHSNDSDLSGYKKALVMVPEDELDVYQAASDKESSDVLIATFATDADSPGVKVIPSGPWVFGHWVAVTSNDKCSLVVEVFKRSALGVETSLFSFVQPVFAVVTKAYFNTVLHDQVELDETDRIVVKYSHRCESSTTRTMYLDVEGDASAEFHWSYIRIPAAEQASGGDFVENVFVEQDPQFPIEYLKYTKNGVDYDVTSIAKANGLIWGGFVSWVELLIFSVTPALYYLFAVLYKILETTIITLDAADPDNPRIDVIAVDNTSTIIVIKGTPAANPQKPSIDPETQIELTYVLIPANGTEPEDIDQSVIYDENTEWTGAGSGVTIDFDNATTPFHNSKCASVGSIDNNDTVTFTTGVPVDVTDFKNLILYLKLKAAMTSQHKLFASFMRSGALASNEVVLSISKSNITDWQSIAIQLTAFTWSQSTVDALRLRWSKSGPNVAHDGFYLDFVKLETGIIQQVVNSAIILTGDITGSGVTGSPVPTTLSTVNSNVGQFGDATNVPKITVDGKGRVTAIENVAVTIPPAISPTSDPTPVDTDEVVSLRGTSWLKTTWTVLKAFLKTYFDGIYSAINHTHTFISLTDTPLAYTGAGDKFVKVNGGATGLEFVDAPSGGGAMSIIDHSTGSFTLALTDAENYLTCNYPSGFNVTVPKNSVVEFPVGTTICLEQTGNGAITMAPVDVDVTLVAYDGLTSYGQYAVLTIVKKGTDLWTIIAGTGF